MFAYTELLVSCILFYLFFNLNLSQLLVTKLQGNQFPRIQTGPLVGNRNHISHPFCQTFSRTFWNKALEREPSTFPDERVICIIWWSCVHKALGACLFRVIEILLILTLFFCKWLKIKDQKENEYPKIENGNWIKVRSKMNTPAALCGWTIIMVVEDTERLNYCTMGVRRLSVWHKKLLADALFGGVVHLSGPVWPTEQRADLSLLWSWNWRVEHGFYMLACVYEIQTVHHTLNPISTVETSHKTIMGTTSDYQTTNEPDAVILCTCLHFYSVIINLGPQILNPPNWVEPKPNSPYGTLTHIANQGTLIALDWHFQADK